MFSSDTICYFNAGSSDTAELLGNYLSKILIKNGFSDIAPVLLCIGSDRVTGDSLGPMVGSALEERYKKSIPVFGTLKMPVHALNLEETIDAIHLHFPDHPLIAVDASFGTKEHLLLKAPPPSKKMPDGLVELFTFMETNLARSFSLRELARHYGCSISHLMRLFHAYCHTTPHRMLTELRMRRAVSLLLETELSIKEIASEVGYENSLNFSTEFKKKHHVSPREFRKKTLSQ